VTASVIIVSGQSGSGKSTAIRALEDCGYLCVDNVPVSLANPLIKTIESTEPNAKVALVIDARDPGLLKDAPQLIADLRARVKQVRLIYMESREEILIRRFSATRRKHPLDQGAGLTKAIAQERQVLAELREVADDTIDTSTLNSNDLRRHIIRRVAETPMGELLFVSLLSFGYKHGVPLDADLVLDVRFLPNPYFVPDLKELSGQDEEVFSFVMETPDAQMFLEKTRDYLDFLIPRFRQEGKSYLTVAIGCTGGQHRSVSVVRALAKDLGKAGMPAYIHHRDVSGGSP